MRFLNLNNYKDKTFRALIIINIFGNALIAVLLAPLLEFVVISLPKESQHFYNYATISTIVGGLPSIVSILISYLVTNMRYKTVLKISLGGIIGLSLFTLITQTHNFLILAAFIVACGVLYQALSLAVDKQIVTLLPDKLIDYSADTYIMGGIIAAGLNKLSGFLFTHYGINGILIVFIVGCFAFRYFAAQATPTTSLSNCNRSSPQISQENNNLKPRKPLKLPNIQQVMLMIFAHKELFKLLTLMLLVILCVEAKALLLITKFHHERISVNTFATLESCSILLAVCAGLCCKSSTICKITPHNSYKFLALMIALIGICYIGAGVINRFYLFLAVLLFGGFLLNIFVIMVNVRFARLIGTNDKLKSIVPIIFGFMTSMMYLVSVISPIIVNPILKYGAIYGIDYHVLFITSGVLLMLLSIPYSLLKSAQTP